MGDRKVLREYDNVSSSVNTDIVLDARVNYVLRLYDASRNNVAVTPELQLGFKDNIKDLTLEERLELLRYIKFKSMNFEIIQNKRGKKRYLKAAEYLYLNFIEG